ncbi:MAG: hypothetical protein K2L75_00135 [Muribaculaceae bacterium]|nr:hypothetical protein [Muribaculaceae bacterium]
MTDQMMNVSADHIGWIVWAVWVLIGVFAALVAQRFPGLRRAFLFDLVIGVVASTLGGYLSTRFLGDTPVQLFLLSVLGAVFFAAAALWITGSLTARFRKDEGLDE